MSGLLYGLVQATTNTLAALRATVDGALLVQPAGTVPTTDTLNGTRAYTWSAGTREAFPTTSTAALALPALGARREVRIVASARCFVRFGESGLAAATVAAGQAIFPADCPEVIVIPVGVTHYRVIGETVSGSISIAPVA